MALSLMSLRDLPGLGFDTIIDVRAPLEYAEDHVPGAINLPVLSDAERAHVGTIYKQQSPFLARKVGAALVARNAAAHLEGPLCDKSGGWRPLVYCWRGGQRSGSFASILTQVGWRVDLIAGGYKHYRHLVVRALYDDPVPSPVVVLDGNTGTAKTALLAALSDRGVQVLDLEGLANHRGSLFGGRQGGQPSQKAFEGALAQVLAGLDPNRPVVVEAESSKVGNRNLPPRLWAAMCAAPRVVIRAPLAARAAYLAQAYQDIIADPLELDTILAKLSPLHAAKVIAEWRVMAAEGAYVALAHDLMARHYDPRYSCQRDRVGAHAPQIFETDSLSPDALNVLADRLVPAVAALAFAIPA
ncbi:MAG: tRNA 2-selenouridine(34) synthase MnmH [Paracoccaceae bacterium]|nr:tRNA 2-selenouridine(34) synthase MnmH [Paracoccaceae bacterium]